MIHSAPEPELLFVYGTLRSEFDNPYARLLRAGSRFGGRAEVRGSVFRIGPYPGYRSLPDGAVQGELYEPGDPAALFRLLDEYEGPEFERVPISLENGVRAWIYTFLPEPAPGTRIDSGDFIAP